MTHWVSTAFLLAGAFFMFVAAVGLVRFPDIYTRMSATTKAATFGVGFNLAAAAIEFKDAGVTVRAIGVLLFLFLTAPVAAHLIGRSAYLAGVPMWRGTISDELREYYSKLYGGLKPEAERD